VTSGRISNSTSPVSFPFDTALVAGDSSAASRVEIVPFALSTSISAHESSGTWRVNGSVEITTGRLKQIRKSSMNPLESIEVDGRACLGR